MVVLAAHPAAAAHSPVGRHEPDGVHPYEDLAGCRLRLGYVGELAAVTDRVEDEGLHGSRGEAIAGPPDDALHRIGAHVPLVRLDPSGAEVVVDALEPDHLTIGRP
jgi:hypothetical protein